MAFEEKVTARTVFPSAALIKVPRKKERWPKFVLLQQSSAPASPVKGGTKILLRYPETKEKHCKVQLLITLTNSILSF